MRCRWTSTWRWSFLEKSLKFHSISTITLKLLDWTVTIESWKDIPLEFHWLTINSVQVSAKLKMIWTTPIFVSIQCLIVYLTKTQNRIWKYVDLCVLETHDLFITNQRQVLPWRAFPVESHLVRKPILQMCVTSVSLWDLWCSWWNANCLSNFSPWLQMLAMLKTKTFPYCRMFVAVFRCIFWKIGSASFALDHSPCARMIWILTTFPILLRCKNPYYRFQQWIGPCAVRIKQVALFWLPSIHQISTLEKTKSYQHSILSSLMSKLLQQVALFFDAAQFASSEEIDFHVRFSPGFLMQWRQTRQESFRCIARLNSPSVSTLLWLFLHLNLFAFFSTSLQNNLQNWNGQCWTNTKDDSIHHVWNFSWLACLRVGFGCRCIWFEFRDPD